MTGDERPTWNDSGPEDELLAPHFRRSGQPPAARCPAPELVQAARAGVLPEPAQARVATHVAQCIMCEALGEALEDPSMGGLTPEENERIAARVRSRAVEPRRSFLTWRLSAAAAVVLVAVGLVVLRQSRSSQPPSSTHDTAAGTSSVLRLEKPDVPPAGGSDLVWRGAADPQAAEDLARALTPFRAGDYGDAARLFRTLVDRRPEYASGHYYLGVSELFLAEDARAAASLERAERLVGSGDPLAQDIAWYLALAYARTGQAQRAIDKLDALCRGASSRAERSCAAARELTHSSRPGTR